MVGVGEREGKGGGKGRGRGTGEKKRVEGGGVWRRGVGGEAIHNGVRWGMGYRWGRDEGLGEAILNGVLGRDEGEWGWIYGSGRGMGHV